MTIIEIKFKEVQEFAIENGYIIAIYLKEKDGNWHLSKEMIDYDDISPDIVVLAGNIKGNINMNETVTKDKKYLFKIHNNYNLPKVIPCFPEK